MYSDNVICVDIEEGQEFGAQDMFENDDKKELVPSGECLLYLRFKFAGWTLIHTFFSTALTTALNTDPKYLDLNFVFTSFMEHPQITLDFWVGSTG